MSANQVSKSEFKAKALEYFRQVEASGESLVVTNHGAPVLEVRPYRGIKRNPIDVLRGSVIRYDKPTQPIAADDWEAAQ
jgi:prevent-host-death family protein